MASFCPGIRSSFRARRPRGRAPATRAGAGYRANLVVGRLQRASIREVRGHLGEPLTGPRCEPPVGLLLHPVCDGPEDELAADVGWGRRFEERLPALLELCARQLFQGLEIQDCSTSGSRSRGSARRSLTRSGSTGHCGGTSVATNLGQGRGRPSPEGGARRGAPLPSSRLSGLAPCTLGVAAESSGWSSIWSPIRPAIRLRFALPRAPKRGSLGIKASRSCWTTQEAVE